MKLLNSFGGGGEIILKNQDSFIPRHIFECGQAFRWSIEEDGSYTLIAHNRVINVCQSGQDIIIRNTNEEDFENIWKNYFDLNVDYSQLKSKLAIDDTMKKAMDYGEGIRILNQDPFETIITFIVSANNRIPMIQRSINLISQTYGKKIEEINGEVYYDFPSPEELSKAKIEDLRAICRVGFRDERIHRTANIISSGEFNLQESLKLDRESLRTKLMELPGVGPKVADCILLFAYNFKDSFPVDVWIKRVMENLYFDGKETKKNNIGILGREIFGEYAGLAQQYLFFYGRENNIGK